MKHRPRVAPTFSRELRPRMWRYLQPPSMFGISGCHCGNRNCEWSNYEDRLWCDKCQDDFIPDDRGIFEGPILISTAHTLGIRFDRINLLTGEIERFDVEQMAYITQDGAVVDGPPTALQGRITAGQNRAAA